jgi:hypothetical protein
MPRTRWAEHTWPPRLAAREVIIDADRPKIPVGTDGQKC